MSILSPEVLRALQKEYINGFAEKWKHLNEAFKNSSWSSMERDFHKFSGSGATYKMPEISKLAKAIELYLEKNSPPDISVMKEAMTLFGQVLEGRKNNVPLDIKDHPVFDKLN